MRGLKRIVLVLAVFSVAYAGFLFWQGRALREAGLEIERQALEVTFRVEAVENNVGDYIVPGATVVDHESGLYFGNIKTFKLEPHREAVLNEGRSVLVEFPHKSDLWITVEASATDLNNSYVVAAKKLGIGKKIALYSKGYAFYGAIMGIEEIGHE